MPAVRLQESCSVKIIGQSARNYLIAAFCAAFLLRLFVLMQATCIELDGIAYATMAEQFARGQFGQALGNVFSPMYPAVVALFHLIIPDTELAARIVSLVSGMLVLVISFFFARRFFGDEMKATWAVVLLAFHPYLIRYSGQALSESLAVLLFAVTLFSFYLGYHEKKRWPLPIAGLLLCLTYLTRPEYLVYYAPFVLVLLWRRRPADALLFLSPFLVLGSLYLLHLHAQHNAWVVSNKAVTSPFVPLTAALGNLPLVSYEFIAALSPIPVLLIMFGIRAVPRPYTLLIALLVVFHIASLSLVGHATKRYSVEFVPICVLCAAQGFEYLRSRCSNLLKPGAATAILAAVVAIAGIALFYQPARHDRALYKQAGMFLRTYDPGRAVAARLPLVAFYGRGTAVNLLSDVPDRDSVDRLRTVLHEKKVRYLAIDEKTEREVPAVKGYIAGQPYLKEFRRGDAFMRIYRLPDA
jgi:4-amino-4-deoxy-L-arabinose transferase-like glycosyltransferase